MLKNSRTVIQLILNKVNPLTLPQQNIVRKLQSLKQFQGAPRALMKFFITKASDIKLPSLIQIVVILLGITAAVLTGQSPPDTTAPEDSTRTNDPSPERSTIELEGTKQTDYLEDLSKQNRSNRYLREVPTSKSKSPAKTLDFTEPPPVKAKSSQPLKTLAYNQLEFSLGTHNHVTAQAYITRYFNSNLFTLNIEANYASAHSLVTTNQYTNTHNSETIRLLVEQTTALTNEKHLITIRHLTQIKGLQSYSFLDPTFIPPSNFNPASDPAPIFNDLRHSLFLNAIGYRFEHGFISEAVEDLTLTAQFYFHYGQHFLTGSPQRKILERHLIEESQTFKLTFTKNIIHEFDFLFSLAFATFPVAQILDTVITTFFTYRYNHKHFILHLGLGSGYRMETLGNEQATVLPILPKFIFEFPQLSYLTIKLGLEGFLTKASLEEFYETSAPLVFKEATFTTDNRYFQNFAALQIHYQKYIHWTLRLLNDLYLSDIETIVLDDATLLARKARISASAQNIIYTLGVSTEIAFSFPPYITFKQKLNYTASEIKDIYPTLTLRGSLVLSENIIHSKLTLTHLYTFEDFYRVLSADVLAAENMLRYIDRSRHELNLRYEIQVFHQAQHHVNLFFSVTSLVSKKNYNGIPYLEQPLSLIQGGVQYIF
ncbi:hypothetical protein COTS27_00631 [Spirochaetota bacterium]|nr:hypothetical protein COTS27_00631 [Spirochaetota bacterium]